MIKPTSSTRQSTPVVLDRIGVVYDPAGQILHVHRVTALQGGRLRSDDEIGRAALEHAQRGRHGTACGDARVLLVDAHALRPGHTHRVDVEARTLRAEARKR